MMTRMTGVLVLVLACAGVHPQNGFPSWGPPAAMAQEEDIPAAQSLYDQNRFEEAATTIREGLSSGRIIGGQVVSARELLARCQVKLGDAAGARRTFLAILRQDRLYRPDPLRIPPDEMEVYNLARRDFDAELERASQRIPASLGLHFGVGSGDNEDFGEVVAAGGGDSKYENDPLFGGSVRFPLAARWSLDLMIERFHATNSDSFTTGGIKYEITAIPVAVSVAYLLLDRPNYRAYAFAGAGPLLEASSSLDLPFFGIQIQIADDKVGTYFHVGAEGEYRVHPRFAVTGRVLARSAKATGLFDDSDFEPYVAGNSVKDRDVDFSGVAATVGLRAYIGY